VSASIAKISSILDLISQSNLAPVLVLKSLAVFMSAEPAESDFEPGYKSVKLCLLRMSILSTIFFLLLFKINQLKYLDPWGRRPGGVGYSWVPLRRRDSLKYLELDEDSDTPDD
jgi:hypothetical protein